MQVALFITCFNDTLFPNVGIATTQLLERLGHTVDFPEAQTCCGQMHFNTGYQRESVPLVRHFVEVFRNAEVIVAPSASCVGMVRDLYPKAAAHSACRTPGQHGKRGRVMPSNSLPIFPQAAKSPLATSQLRRNLGKATTTIRNKRAAVVSELPDWEALRAAGSIIKAHVMRHL